MRIGIIGGGASGLAAAIEAARNGAEVTLLERNDRVGKKLLATGNGKCNLSNLDFSPACYRSNKTERVVSILERFGPFDALDFFHGLGLLTKEKQGYVYPLCEQASAVVDVLRFSLARYGVCALTGHRVTKIRKIGNGFRIWADREGSPWKGDFDKIILACGSPAGVKSSGEQNSLTLAESLGLSCYPFTEALVQLRCKEGFMKSLSGVRCQGEISVDTGNGLYRERGELQLTDYGISGIPVFQLSRYAVLALKEKKELAAEMDFLPELSEEEWIRALNERYREFSGECAEICFTGTVHKKIVLALLKRFGIQGSLRVREIEKRRFLEAGLFLKHFRVTINGSNAFAQAQVCAGGVCLDEIGNTMEAASCKNLYVAGEMLDADGRCGGYNLQWAWTTGILAGRNAAGRKDDSNRTVEAGG